MKDLEDKLEFINSTISTTSDIDFSLWLRFSIFFSNEFDPQKIFLNTLIK